MSTKLQNYGKRTIMGNQVIDGITYPFALAPDTVLEFDDKETVDKLLNLYPLEVRDIAAVSKAAADYAPKASGIEAPKDAKTKQ
jgi:hypothetical protein